MAGRLKHARVCDNEAGPPAQKRGSVHIKTAQKWVAENDKALGTSVWLRFEKGDRDHVAVLKCAVCAQFEERLVSMCNYRPVFIHGTTNVRTSTFKEHAATEMHARAMALFRKW